MNIKQGQPDASVVVADPVLPIGSIGPIVGYEGNLNVVTVADLPTGQLNRGYFGDRIAMIVETLRSTCDFVILDIGRSLSRISLPLIQHADLIALIVSADHRQHH